MNPTTFLLLRPQSSQLKQVLVASRSITDLPNFTSAYFPTEMLSSTFVYTTLPATCPHDSTTPILRTSTNHLAFFKGLIYVILFGRGWMGQPTDACGQLMAGTYRR